jgi:hypothetical protein
MQSKVVICICGYCHKDFARKKENISRSLKPRPNKKFCSKTCHALYNNTSVEKPCGYCMATVTRTLAEFKSSKSGKIFCNSSCAATYSNSHKTHGTRVSKLENFIKKKLTEKYPDVEIHYNRKDTINSELDIYIPNLKLAFELNGIFHYEPIYGPDKLVQIRNNDNRKMQACLEQNIELCTIDTSSLSYFKEDKAMKYYNIIIRIIQLKFDSVN